MIRYALVCAEEHEFDGWFAGSQDFDRQIEERLVECPICGSAAVTKALMAPSVATARSRPSPAVATAPGESAGSVPAAVANHPVLSGADAKTRKVLDAMRQLKQRLISTAEYVGPDFAEEARKMHYGEAEARGIYGEATVADAAALHEEGIEVHVLPTLPDDSN